jgi:hypothetical protein
LWTYTSATNTVTHTVLPAPSAEPRTPDEGTYDPAAVATEVLRDVTPTTAITVDRTRVVAGHAAYTLLVRPRDTRSTIRVISIALDSRTYVPLQVQVFGTGSSPAFQVGFTHVSFGVQPQSRFVFHPPAGARLSAHPFDTTGPAGQEDNGMTQMPPTWPGDTSGQTPTVIGSGWTSILELRGGQYPGLDASGLLGRATSPIGSTGSRLLHTALINAVFTADGRVFIGSVSPDFLEHVAATTAH